MVSDEFGDALAVLRRERDRETRGYRFEHLVKRLFEQAGYETVINPGAARPRQTDLHARRGADEYIVEAKWQSRPADLEAIAGLRDRLERIPTRLAGAFFSMSGYTRGAITEVETHRQREIVLFNAHEVDAIIQGALNLHQVLQRKRRALSRDARVLFLGNDEPNIAHLGEPDLAAFPPPNARIHDANGTPLDWIVGSGEFGPLVFAKELPDVDWSALEGFPVGLDVQLPIEEEPEIARILDVLRRTVGLGGLATFSLQQAQTMWCGCGVANFLDAIDQRESRYAALPSGTQLHHTEEATLYSDCIDGFMTLQIDLDARGSRRVWHAGLSFVLVGWPVDSTPYSDLATAVGLDRLYFRPLAAKAIAIGGGMRRRLRLEPVQGFLRSWVLGKETVTGLIARNPFFRRPRLLSKDLGDTDAFQRLSTQPFVICDLAHWHGPTDAVDYYYLKSVEGLWTSEANILRPVADWNDLVVQDGQRLIGGLQERLGHAPTRLPVADD